MHIVVVVVTGDVAWQHAGVWRVCTAAYQRESHTGRWLHGEIAQHADMAVTTADQDNIAKYGLVSGLHWEWSVVEALAVTSGGPPISLTMLPNRLSSAHGHVPERSLRLSGCIMVADVA